MYVPKLPPEIMQSLESPWKSLRISVFPLLLWRKPCRVV